MKSREAGSGRRKAWGVRLRVGAALAVSTTLLVGVAPADVEAAPRTIIVTSTGDGGDASNGTGPCADSAGNCTLRAALQTGAAFTSDRVTIEFDIPGGGVKTISVPSVLRVDNGTKGITIDGFTQPGARPNTSTAIDNAERRIKLVGRGPTSNQGLFITGTNNVVRGLVMNRFSTAIRFDGSGGSPDGDFNEIVGNLIGLEPDGSLVSDYRLVANKPCISLISGAGFNRIGTADPADRNTISGCYEKALYLDNPNTFGNKIQNNIIGMDPTGTQRRANQFGVDINGGAKNNIVGGTGANEGNLLSGNTVSAVEISHDPETTGNDVVNNLIGTDPSGNSSSAATRSGEYAIRLEGRREANVNSCGENSGMSDVTGNVIVNARLGGILVDKGFVDSNIVDNGIGVTSNGTVVGNGVFGVRIVQASSRILVRDNDIGGGQYGVQVDRRALEEEATILCQTDFNTIGSNRMSDLTANGIDLFPYGDPSESQSPSELVNQGVERPRVFSSGGSVDVKTCNQCVVELFGTTRPAGLNGVGTNLIATANAGGNGVATFAEPGGGWPSRITATSTTPQGSTSEFSVTIVPTSATEPTPQPTVSSVDSNNARRAASVTATVRGSGFQADARVTIVGAANGVTISSVDVANGSVITFVVTASSDASLGPRDIRITNGDGTSVNSEIVIAERSGIARIDMLADAGAQPLESADRIGNRVST